jgi:AAA domain, putative AbiEii toxin, Type IV TA system/AAA domain
MRLIKLKVTDFRRFAGEQSLDLNEDLIALVGPNEAGKSSILGAIEMVGRSVPPAATDTTRGLAGPAAIAALFTLDPDDRAVLTGIHSGDTVHRIWVTRTAGQDLSTWGLEASPLRDLVPRHRCKELVEALDGDPALDAAYSTGADWPWNHQAYLDAQGILASSSETLPDEAISALEVLGNSLRAIRYPPPEAEVPSADVVSEERRREAAREATASALLDLADIERRPTPWRQIVNALDGRIPDVAFFSAPDRELLSTYQLDEVVADPPAALRNICALAELDLGAVQAALVGGRTGHAERLFELANARLKGKFQDTWRQSTVYPRLGAALDRVLRVFVATEDGDYTFPEERSDGLRWFMALHAFLAARGQHEPILLVDEAETHLHYDAQADLIDALMSQRIARQVVYTTHSVGCLPPDLGCGIRVMLAEEGKERSRITNSYWSVDPAGDDKVGYTPLLFAMGARLLALTIPRFGVIVEGPSDAILLPSLLRQATGLSALPYRVVPGLSEIAQSNVPSLSHHGGKVVSLADGDSGGRAICDMLRDGGVPAASVFHLGDVRADCTLEDVVDGGVLADAINRELETWGIDPLRVVATDLPPTARWAWLVQQGEATATPIERLSKPRVAQRIVDIGRSARESFSPRVLVNAADVDSLRELHERLCAELGAPSGARK